MVASAQVSRRHQGSHQALKGALEIHKENRTQGFYRRLQKDLGLEGRTESLPRTLIGGTTGHTPSSLEEPEPRTITGEVYVVHRNTDMEAPPIAR